jgi:tetratricopeptide (TPR) repeat protein
MNTRRGTKSARELLLLHEAGHVLGLAFRPANASAGHCLDRTCLMYKTLAVHLKRLLLGQNPITQRQLCDRCVAQLAESSRRAPSANLRFVGPVLVRSEAGYHVLSLPHRSRVIVGNLADQDCRDFAAAVRAETPLPGDDDGERRADGLPKEEVLREPAKLCAILDRAKADPYELVRSLASGWWARAWTERYLAGRQFTNAVEICRQAILANPKDDWSYNHLAWIKATCSESTIRDGKEAVAAARKACELTDWKQWSWIDTLAAAYAEAGDFKRALELEEQALRTGHPGESDQKEMRERIALYKQSRPFRDKP